MESFKDAVVGFLASPSAKTPATGALAILGLVYAANKALKWHYLRTSSTWDWKKEIVLVTGGSSGIGNLMVRNLARRNIKVVAIDVQPPATPFPASVRFYKLDVTSSSAISETAKCIRKDVGDPTVVVNNAGVGFMKPILDETEDEVRRTFDVNIVAHFAIIKEFLPHMIREDHGHVVTIASMATFLTIASNVAYSCTKAAALSFHEGLGQELKYRYNARNVCTSIVHPMFIRTPLIESVIGRATFTEPLLDPNDVAETVTRHIVAGQSGQIFLPGYCSLISGLRGFPVLLQELVRGSKASVLADETSS
ncbi:hypothetical protein CSOJ01_11271 [Colletotrichum sojae]|uniref:Short-chain dehydrogenase/reductase 3 n=1 Tax=Colletotrichum sojae TaxID=2175907 RepID=A0A8H6IXW3_9PEZI|nr:hypothetical protein CSOJ01_11271 [Colletotrichum sojae]